MYGQNSASRERREVPIHMKDKKKRSFHWLKAGLAGMIILILVICYREGPGAGNGALDLTATLETEDAAADPGADGSGGAGSDAGGSGGVESDAGGSGGAGSGADGSGGVESGAGVPESAGPETGGGAAPEKGDPEAAGGQEPSEAPSIFIHVCGEVTAPGVYEMERGSRIYEAVEAAGGLTDAAAADVLNLAQVLEDGQQVRVPDQEEKERLEEQGGALSFVTGGRPEQEAPAAKVNLNTATKEQLMTLSGIGEARAEAILAYRQESGGFRTPEDIMKVSGIKEAAFQKIKDEITV